MKAVVVVPFGGVEEDVLTAVSSAITAAYPVTARRGTPLAEPEGSLDAVRRQHSGPSFLAALVRSCPPEAYRILGLTDRDLFIPMLSFVFGQAQLAGPAAVVALARLHQEFHGLSPSPALLLARVRKEAIHELGHTFGLTHCPEAACPMSLSVNVADVDRKTGTLCRTCASLVRESQARRGDLKEGFR